MIETLFQIERDAYKDSPVHRLDARVKIVIAFAAIIALVAVPYSPMIYSVGALFFLFFGVTLHEIFQGVKLPVVDVDDALLITVYRAIRHLAKLAREGGRVHGVDLLAVQ